MTDQKDFSPAYLLLFGPIHQLHTQTPVVLLRQCDATSDVLTAGVLSLTVSLPNNDHITSIGAGTMAFPYLSEPLPVYLYFQTQHYNIHFSVYQPFSILGAQPHPQITTSQYILAAISLQQPANLPSQCFGNYIYHHHNMSALMLLSPFHLIKISWPLPTQPLGIPPSQPS